MDATAAVPSASAGRGAAAGTCAPGRRTPPGGCLEGFRGSSAEQGQGGGEEAAAHYVSCGGGWKGYRARVEADAATLMLMTRIRGAGARADDQQGVA